MSTQPLPEPQPPGAAPPADRPRRGGRWPRRVLVTVLVLVLLLLGYGIALYFWAGSKLHTTDAFARYPGRPDTGEGTNWLLVGSDSRERLTPEQRRKLHVGGEHGQNTDTIMILHYGSSGPYLVSLPRDSYVAIPGHGRGKINAAYALGGPRLLTRTVEQATGLHLHHYAEVSFLGYVHVVDELGGVRICVPRGGLHDEKSGADFDAGCQEMNGTQALAYVRARYSDPQGDLGRVRRQRQLVGAVADKALSFPVLVSPWRHIPFTESALDALTVDTGTGIAPLTRMGLKTKDLSEGKGATTTVPIGSQTTIAGVGDVVLWDEAKAKRLFRALREDERLPKG
ncbi:LCP family protein [Streptomyces sp. NA04227]|uniref:LCP family protein n=1 Tax=Streptomyces sp. NA04227 TaxID=2742136 RepID=UPI001590449A|nr:LCP family protein [Streptomyces sp. NA04227]QKW07045.1 LCP family protein [Streptomyces sp. NA04227]